MSEIDLQQARLAWRNASSADIARALQELDEYPPAVATIVREEAEQRGVSNDSDETLADPTYEMLRPIGQGARSVAGRAARGLYDRLELVRAHPYISAAVLGILHMLISMTITRVLLPWIGYGATAALVMTIYLGGILLICLPLRRYRVAILVPIITNTIAFAAGFTVGQVILALESPASPLPPPRISITMTSLTLMVFAGVPALLLSAIVFVRNRYWPYYEPGRCRVCEYNLHGLPEPRCPECGTPFEAE